jgi:hypothetical protein
VHNEKEILVYIAGNPGTRTPHGAGIQDFKSVGNVTKKQAVLDRIAIPRVHWL